MVKTKIVGAAGRFGERYGQLVRRRIADIESKQRIKQVCIFCNGRVKRTSKGLWNCKKCGKRFAQHAYFLEQTESEKKQKDLKEQKQLTVNKTKKTKTNKKTE